MRGTLSPSASAAGRSRSDGGRRDVPPADRILPMDGLRGIAVTLVFFVHYATLAEGTPDFGHALAEAGRHGVELFFALSGYVIYRAAMSPRLELGRFLVRRAHRLYPAFLAMFVLYIGLCFAFPAESKIPRDPAEAALFLAANLALLPGLLPIVPLISVTWSLSYQIAYYLACPALCLLLRLRRWPARWRVAFWLLVAVAAFALGHGNKLRAVLFVSGILVYEARDLRVPGRPAALLFLLVLVGAATGVLAGPVKFAVLFVSIGLLCISAFRGGPISRPLSWAPLRWLGAASYSYYLIHGLVLKAITTVMPMPYWWMLVPAFAATLAGTAVLHYFIERPLSLARPKRAAPGAPPLPVGAVARSSSG
jgi:peptidoglycan/LPS O-acetylase OafA/YrhL